MTTTTMSLAKMSLKFSTNCDGCGRMFRFESNDLADLDSSRWPTKCDECRAPSVEQSAPAKPKRRGKR